MPVIIGYGPEVMAYSLRLILWLRRVHATRAKPMLNAFVTLLNMERVNISPCPQFHGWVLRDLPPHRHLARRVPKQSIFRNPR